MALAASVALFGGLALFEEAFSEHQDRHPVDPARWRAMTVERDGRTYTYTDRDGLVERPAVAGDVHELLRHRVTPPHERTRQGRSLPLFHTLYRSYELTRRLKEEAMRFAETYAPPAYDEARRKTFLSGVFNLNDLRARDRVVEVNALAVTGSVRQGGPAEDAGGQ